MLIVLTCMFIYTRSHKFNHPIIVKHHYDLLDRQSSGRSRIEVTCFYVGDFFCFYLGSLYADFQDKYSLKRRGKSSKLFIVVMLQQWKVMQPCVDMTSQSQERPSKSRIIDWIFHRVQILAIISFPEILCGYFGVFKTE